MLLFHLGHIYYSTYAECTFYHRCKVPSKSLADQSRTDGTHTSGLPHRDILRGLRSLNCHLKIYPTPVRYTANTRGPGDEESLVRAGGENSVGYISSTVRERPEERLAPRRSPPT